jgi:hypothetical protein
MTEFKQDQATWNDLLPGSAATLVLRQAEMWLRAQSDLLSNVDRMWTRWMQRQHEAISVSVRSLTQISECRDLGNIIQIQQRWLAHTVERTTSDWSALAKDAVELTWRVARVEGTSDQTRKPSPNTRGEGTGDRASLHQGSSRIRGRVA